MIPEACDVAVPVPLDRVFTYRLPETLRHRVQRGCRVLVPFGTRKLMGVVMATHASAHEATLREVLRLIDEEPVLGESLLKLGEWIAAYYCAPLGEVLRGMTPLAGEQHRTQVFSLTDAGRDAARQLLLGQDAEDPTLQLLRLLEQRALSAAYLKKKVESAPRILKSLARKGLVALEEDQTERDPLRAPAARLLVEFVVRPEGVKLSKAERELAAYLELHPGPHNLGTVDKTLPGSSAAARALARKGLLAVRLEPTAFAAGPARPPHQLNAHQDAAFVQIRDSIASQQFRTFLLHGVTGSGKTEVYLRSIEEALTHGRGAILLVPEIALTPAVAGQFFHRFGDRVAMLHSAFTDSERAEQWRRIRAGVAKVVVGTRSGVFAPVANLGLIIVDEEHDSSYKQEETPRYHGRDVAILRAQAAGATMVLGSATPSMESRYNSEKGKYTLLSMPERIEQRPLPKVEMIDMRVEFLETRRQAVFSRRLLEALQQRLENSEQSIVLLNRRGFSSFVSCRSCGHRVQCVNCAVTLTYHKRDRRMLCHYCNYAEKIPAVCPQCQSEHIYFLGTGSEKVEHELHTAFPTARIARLDRDTVTGKRHYEEILGGFRDGSFDILVGTQMIAKGHDIPNVTLVGVVSADVGLGMPDFRAAERTFQLLTQVAGRAGRGELPGQVILQTINPDHYAVQFAAAQDYGLFYEKELNFRRLMRYPPFAALANIVVRAAKQEDALRMSTEIADTIPKQDLKVLGPAEAPVPRLRQEFRYQLLIKATSRKKLNATLQSLRQYAQEKSWSPTALVIDVDPLSLL